MWTLTPSSDQTNACIYDPNSAFRKCTSGSDEKCDDNILYVLCSGRNEIRLGLHGGIFVANTRNFETIYKDFAAPAAV